MKKIFTSIAVLAACAVGATAQKNIDLEAKIIRPTHLTEYPNFNNGDSLIFAVEATNLGPDVITASDSLFYYLEVFRNPSTNARDYLFGASSGSTIPVGGKDTFAVVLRQGQTINDVIVKFPPNAFDTLLGGVLGFSFNAATSSREFFIDQGFDASTLFTANSNNLDGIAVKFGGVGIKDILAGANKEALTVYPNPTKGELKFDYNFKNTTDAAIRVTDIAGRVVYTQTLGNQAAGNQSFNINLGNLANGMYTIELNAGDNRATSQFNINK